MNTMTLKLPFAGWLSQIRERKERKGKHPPKWVCAIIYHKMHILLALVVSCAVVGGIGGALCETYTSKDGTYESKYEFQVAQHDDEMPMLVGKLLSAVDTIYGIDDTAIGNTDPDTDSMGFFQKMLSVTYSKNGESETLSVAGKTMVPEMMTFFRAISKIFQSAGVILLIIYLGLGLMEMTTSSGGDIIYGQLIRRFLYFCVGLVLVTNAPTIVFEATNVGTAIISKITAVNAVNLADNPTILAFKEQIYQACTTAQDYSGLKYVGAVIGDLLQVLGFYMELILPLIGIMVSGILVVITCFSRFIEILCTAAISPVMFADISAEGQPIMRTNAMRTFRMILALALQGAMIYMCLSVCNLISVSLLPTEITVGNQASFMWMQVGIAIAKGSIVMKSNQLCRQMVGLG